MDSTLFAPKLREFEPQQRLPEPLQSNDEFGEGAVLAHEQALRHLGDRGFIQFHPVLAERLGHKAALFAGLALYWTRHTTLNQPLRNGWFFMSARQWTQTTGLSAREQSTSRAVLIEHGLLQESLLGRPAVMHYRVNLSKLAQWLGVSEDESVPNREATPRWFRGYICFYKPLADLAGNVACGLYLSYLLQLQRNALRDQHVQGAIRVSQDEVSIALCLGSKVQRNARERLKLAGLLRDSGPSLVMLNLPAILACLEAQESKALPQARKAKAAALPPLSLVRRPVATPPAVSGGRIRTAESAPLLRADAQLQLGLMGLAVQLAQPSHENKTAAASTLPLNSTLSSIRGLIGATYPDVSAGDPLAGIKQVGFMDHGPSIAENAKLAGTSIAENAILERTEIAENAKLDVLTVAENAKLKLPKTQPHISICITNTTTTRARGEAVDNSTEAASPRRRRLAVSPSDVNPVANSAGCSKADDADIPLAFPDALDAAFLPGVRSVLAKAPRDSRQALLDELDGQLRIQGKTIHNPAGWLMGLIRQYRSGDVVLAMAEKVSADRVHRQRIQRQVERARLGESAQTRETLPAATADPAVIKAARENLRELRAKIIAERGRS